MRKQGVSRVGLLLLVLLFMLVMPMGCMSWSEGKDESTTSVTSPMSPSSILSHGGQPGPETMVEPGSLVAMDLQLDKSSRYALVFGNGKYTKMPALANPVNDANDIAGLLDMLGFNVTLVTDGTQGTMESTLRSFAAEIGKRKADIALFFYAGHGAQFEGVNYLLPVDADIQQAHELSSKALSMELVASTLERTGSSLNLVILDACRDNPFASSRGSTDRGLSAMVRGGNESMVVFSTAPGAVAQDGTDRNSPFTSAFKEHLVTPDLEIRQLVARVSRSVQDSTGARQIPWVNTSFTGEFFFLTTEQLLANNRLTTNRIENELKSLDAEIAARQQSIDAETDMARRQVLELEQQRAKALEEAKSLEASRLAEIRKQAELSLSANRDELARKQVMEASMLEQQESLERDAEQKRKEIEQLERQKIGLINLQSRLELIASMEQAVADIKAQYARTMEILRQEILRGKEANIASYKEVNPRDPWESTAEFESRLSLYAGRLDSEHEAKIGGLETERDAKVRSIGLEGAKAAIQGERFALVASVEVLGFNADTKEFEFQITSKDADVPLVVTMKYQIAGKTREALQSAYTRVDNARRANALTAEIVCKATEAYPRIWRADTEGVVVKTLLEGSSASPGIIVKEDRPVSLASSNEYYAIEKGVVSRVYGILPIRSNQGPVKVYSERVFLGIAESEDLVFVFVTTAEESRGKQLTFELASTNKSIIGNVNIEKGMNNAYTPRSFYQLGDLGPSKGYIFYDKGRYNDGWRYLEAAPAGWSGEREDPKAVFGYYRTSEDGYNKTVGTGERIGNGKGNTEALVSARKSAAYTSYTGSATTAQYAAKMCTEYQEGGYNDWFLPSKDELKQLYQNNLYSNNLGGFSADNYWSSSEEDTYFAWRQDFGNGIQDFKLKDNAYRVRPVRAF